MLPSCIAEDLKFDVVRVLDEFLDVNAGIAESFFRFGAGGVIAFDERNVVVGHAHAASAAAGDGFDHHRIADAFGDAERFLFVFDHAFGTGRRGHAGFFGQGAADGFVLQRIHGARTRPDEADVAALANVGEVRVLGKEPVARMNGVDVGDFRRADDAVDAQVAFVAGRLCRCRWLRRPAGRAWNWHPASE